MVFRLVAFLRRSRATDILLHHQRLQVFARLHDDLQDVLEGFQQGDITIEDLGQE
jgi:hypothetical protein